MKKLLLILLSTCNLVQAQSKKYISDDILARIKEEFHHEYFKFRAEFNPKVNKDSLQFLFDDGRNSQYTYKSYSHIFNLQPYTERTESSVFSTYIPLIVQNYPDSTVKTGLYLIYKPKNIMYDIFKKKYFKPPYFFEELYDFDDYFLCYYSDSKNQYGQISNPVFLSGNLETKICFDSSYTSFLSRKGSWFQLPIYGAKFGIIAKPTYKSDFSFFRDSLDNYQQKKIVYTFDHKYGIDKKGGNDSNNRGALFLAWPYSDTFNFLNPYIRKLEIFFFSCDPVYSKDTNRNNIYMIKYIQNYFSSELGYYTEFPQKKYEEVKPQKILVAKNRHQYYNFLSNYFSVIMLDANGKVVQRLKDKLSLRGEILLMGNTGSYSLKNSKINFIPPKDKF